MSENDAETQENFYERFMLEMNNMLKSLNDKQPQYVPYEMFKQTVEWNTENMRQLYEMLHEMVMEKSFTVEFTIGDFNFTFTGKHEDSEKIIAAADKMATKMANKLLNKERTNLIEKNIQRKKDDQQRSYC